MRAPFQSSQNRAPAPAPQVHRGTPSPPTYTTEQGLILQEIVDEPPPPLAQGLILTEIIDDLSPPPAAPGVLLGEVVDEEPPFEGFERTRLEDAGPAAYRPPPPKPSPPPKRAPAAYEAFSTTSCPECGNALADPTAAFCEHCSHRMPRVKRAAATQGGVRVEQGDMKRCRPCGAKNVATRDRCVDCGALL